MFLIRLTISALALLLAESAWAGESAPIPYPLVDFPPYIALTPDGRVDGWHVRLARALFKSIDLAIEFRETPYARTIEEMREGRLSVMQYADGVGLKREEFYFPVPMTVLEIGVFKHGRESVDDNRLASIAARPFVYIRAWPLGVLTPLLQSDNGSAVADPATLLRMLLADRVVTGVAPVFPILATLKGGRFAADEAEAITYQVADRIEATTIAVPRNRPGAARLSDRLAAAYREMVEQGEIDEACVCLIRDVTEGN